MSYDELKIYASTLKLVLTENNKGKQKAKTKGQLLKDVLSQQA